MPAMIIGLSVPGVAGAVNGYRQVASAMQQVTALQKQMANNQAVLSRGASILPRIPQVGGGGGPAAIGSLFQQAQGGGGSGANRYIRALLSPRSGLVTGNPHFGSIEARLASIFGMTGPQSAFTVGVFAAAAVAVHAFAETVKQAAANLQEFGHAASISGGSGRDIAGLRAYGLSPGEIAGAADRLRSLRSSDPLAMSIAGPQLPSAFGGQNNARALMAEFDRLRVVRQLYGAEEQLRQARILELQGYLDLINVSPRVVAIQREEMRLSEKIFDTASLQTARDLAAEQTNLSNLWNDLTTEMAKPFLREWVDLLHGLNLTLADSVKNMPRLPDITFHPLVEGDNPLDFLGRLMDRGKKASGKDPQEETNEHLKAIRQLLSHGGGGGERVRGAVPILASQSDALSAAQTQKLILGAYRL